MPGNVCRTSMATPGVTPRARSRPAGGRGRIDAAPEHLVLEQPDERLGTEHPDEQVHRVEHEGENGKARQRLSHRTREPVLPLRVAAGQPAKDHALSNVGIADESHP